MSKAGHVAVIGRPNVGKSTLMNHVLGQKIAITSRKPQTTRHALLGIHTIAPHQMVFVDTPGIHLKASKTINRHMNRQAKQSADFVDVIVLVVEAFRMNEEDMAIIERLPSFQKPVVCVVNKIDKIPDKSALLAELQRLDSLYPFAAIIPVSAQHKQNLSALEQKLIELLPEQEWIYSEDEITTASMRFMAAETVREKLFRFLHQEVPYELGVVIEKYQVGQKLTEIHATIIVERDSQKGIVIGKGGQTLKLIGQAAREDLERTLEAKVLLKTFVKVKENWRDNDAILHSMGAGSGLE
ncbi:MAG: GTPase Era [Cardiobacteriaceae bacterium]|nr:GTPase Era [Cardiobacteriaceae bacterium]